MKTFHIIAPLLCALFIFVSPAYAMNQKTACEPTGSIAPLRFNQPAQVTALNSNLTEQEIKQRYEALESTLTSTPPHLETISLLAFIINEGETPCIDKALQARVKINLTAYKEIVTKSIAYYSAIGRSAVREISEKLANPTAAHNSLPHYLERGLFAANYIKLFGIEPSFEKDLSALVDPIKKALNPELLNLPNN